jgi:hypothetical protein
LLAIIIKKHILLVFAGSQSRLTERIYLKLASNFLLVEFGETEYLGYFPILEQALYIKYFVVLSVNNIAVHVD